MSANNSFLKPLWHNGPTPGQSYNFPESTHRAATTIDYDYNKRTAQPINTGTSVVGIKYDGGVIIAADNLVSYGSLARYQNIQRIYSINKNTIIGTGGDYGDFQYLKRLMDNKMLEDTCYDDSIIIKPRELYTWVTRLQYNKRSNFDPLWVDMVVGGIDDNCEPFLGHIDFRGRAYEDDVIATGLGKHLAIPLFRENLRGSALPTKEQAFKLIHKSMEVLFYRDCRSLPQYTLAVCDRSETVIRNDLEINQNWGLASLIKGY